MRKLLFALFLLLTSFGYAQDIQLDKLEMYYDQGHYKMVNRRAERLMDNPEYDNSLVPGYYAAVSSLALYQDKKWKKRHTEALDNAFTYLLALKNSDKGIDLIERHIYELRSLQRDLTDWANDLKLQKEESTFQKVNLFLEKFYSTAQLNNQAVEEKLEETNSQLKDSLQPVEEIDASVQQKIIVEAAREQLGVPYAWAGTTPKGFDCSGYTSYVYKQVNIDLPRRAEDQHAIAKKIKAKNVEIGDLVFFKKGSGINHVGIVISKNNGSIQMIHSSSSIGISIVDIYASKYWEQRLHSFGRML
ncbi:NlpC/P60 family protein [Lishizhenia tianjinensis]|uniref:NlpC/P60 family protein n=1 Tax=Lishizhenia tianjinensis TaxID=477690 RepID=A0A1I7AF23_9FLAO|nr:C40 family peptidase [Lishizhenia tianjinensis]SFT73440.1 NlpC/P60 family protein [Lishizhenia tianjinensis]